MGQQVAHGALDHAELAGLGLRPEALLDFSSNLNPFGPPPGVRAALAALDPAPYPDRSCHRLRLALAERHSCAPGQILAGNGSNELIHLIARALLRPSDSALIIGPAFGEYAQACALAGAHVIEWRASEAGGFAPDAELIGAAIGAARPRLTWLCAPNNPTGVNLDAAAIRELARRCAAHDGFLVVDRAYQSFLRGGAEASDPLDNSPPPNLLRMHSLTKSYALAGLRLGYLLAEGPLLAQIAAFQPTWSVSSAAQAAGLAALADDGFLPATLPQLWASSDMLLAGLRGLGLPVWRAALPFMLVRTDDGPASRAALLGQGLVVRDCSSFGLPAWLRIAPQRIAQNELLIRALVPICG